MDMVDKNCHNKQFVTISGVTISGKQCIHILLRTNLLQWRRIVFDADPVERLVGAVEGHVVADEGEVARVDGDPVRPEHAHDLADDDAVCRLDAVVP